MTGYLSGQDGAILASRDYPLCPARKIFPKAKYNSFIDQAFSAKMAGYSPRSLLPVYTHADKEHGQYPAILTSHMVNNPYLIERENQGVKRRKRGRSVVGISKHKKVVLSLYY